MRRLGEAMQPRRVVLAEVYYPASGANEGNRKGEGLLTPSGEIECGANFTRDTATDSPPHLLSLSLSLSPLPPFLSAFILFRTRLFHRSFRTDKRTPFFLSFPLIVESEAL